jgi:O-antigen ligase
MTAKRRALHPLWVVGFVVAGLVAAVVANRRPALAVALLVLTDPFEFHQYVWRTTITLPKVVLLGIVVGLLVRRVPLAPLWSNEARPLTIGALAICAATALSAIPSTYIDVVARETLKAIEYAIIFAVCVTAIAADPDDDPFRVGLLIAVIAVALLALAQVFGGAPSQTIVAGHVIARISGPLEGPNQLAGYLGLAIPLLLAYTLVRRDVTALVVACLAALTLLLTFSRTGLIATFVAVVLLALVARGASVRAMVRAYFGVLVAACAAAAIALRAGLMQRFETDAPSGLATRSKLWTAALALWKHSPFLGIGAGNYELELPNVGLEGVRTHANSLYLQALAEGGIPLLAAVVWTTIASITTFAFSRVREPLVLGAMAASAGFALHQVFDFLTFYPKVGGLWWIILGTAAGVVYHSRRVAR